MEGMKRFIKELKRVRWPSTKSTVRTFLTTMVFVIIASLFLFLISLFFTSFWGWIGVGLNG